MDFPDRYADNALRYSWRGDPALSHRGLIAARVTRNDGGINLQ